MYMYIFSYSPDFHQNSCGFNFVIKLKIFNYFQNHTARMIFCKICLKVWKTTFWFFKSLDINMVYTLDVYVYI